MTGRARARAKGLGLGVVMGGNGDKIITALLILAGALYTLWGPQFYKGGP